jgi:hypothetical protein
MAANWRKYGPVAYDIWKSTIVAAGGPGDLAARDPYTAAGDLSALCLAMLGHESSFATDFDADPASNLNPLNLRPRGGTGFMAFDSYSGCVGEWRDRLLDPTYRYADTVSIEDLVHVYAPSSDHNNETEYVTAILDRFAAWGVKGGSSGSDSVVTFGLVPKPPIAELICTKLGEGHGFNTVAPRQNVGVCEHITDGHGDIEFYSSFFSIGGEREADALVDFVVGRDGRIGMLNDWRGTRAPWANGNTDGLEGDGPAFLNTFGVDGVNQKLVSIEHEGLAAEDWTGAQWNAAVALDAWLFDQMGVRYDTFPINENFGVVTHLFHSEFTDKGGNGLDECPGRYLKQHIDQFQTEIRAVMMAHQVSATQATVHATPIPTVSWDTHATGIQQLNGVRALAFLGETTAKRDVPVRMAASGRAKVIATIKAGEIATIRGTFRTAKARWALIDLGPKGVGRARLSAFKERWPLPN